MKSRRGNVLVLLLGGLAVIFAALAGYFYLQIPKSINSQRPDSISSIPDSKPTDETVYTEAARSANWKTYINDEYKYEMKYPRDWSAKEISGDHPSGKTFKIIEFSSSDRKYRLLFGLRSKNANTEITTRTGVGAGDLAIYKVVKIGNTDVQASQLVFEGKVKEIFYSNKLGPGVTNLSGYEVVAEFGYVDSLDNSVYEKGDLKSLPELDASDQILSTFRFDEGID